MAGMCKGLGTTLAHSKCAVKDALLGRQWSRVRRNISALCGVLSPVGRQGIPEHCAKMGSGQA